jgi:hypothetical protein
MYVIFIHISGLALIEILFYFLYIGNMETHMFISNIQHLLNNEKTNINYNMYNTSLLDQNYTYVDYYKTRSSNGEQERKENNNKLFTQALLGFIVILSLTFLAILLEFYFRRNVIKKIGSMDTVNNVCLEMVEYNSTSNVDAEQVSEKESNKYKTVIFHMILYAGLMIGFEYWFFNYIIMEYKVISNEEIEYLFAKKISESIKN